jgi:hypothetical protein
MLASYPALAQEPGGNPSEDTRTSSSPENVDPSQSAAPGGRQGLTLDELTIEGKLEKPSALFILRRSSLDYDWARLDARFSPLVLESVQDPLF